MRRSHNPAPSPGIADTSPLTELRDSLTNTRDAFERARPEPEGVAHAFNVGYQAALTSILSRVDALLARQSSSP